MMPGTKIIKLTTLSFVTLIRVLCGFSLFDCYSDPQMQYVESIAVSGTVGSDYGEIPQLETEGESEVIFVSSFAVAPDGSFWISCDAAQQVRQYSINGQLLKSIDMGDKIVDDIVVTDSSRLVISYWNRSFIEVLDTSGSQICVFDLPGDPNSMTPVFSYGMIVFARFTDYTQGNPRTIAFSFDSNCNIGEARETRVSIWSESCGSYFLATDEDRNWFGLHEVLDSTEKSFLSVSDTSKSYVAIGIDSMHNLYVCRRLLTSGKEVQYIVNKYSKEGDCLASFPIVDCELNYAHFTKVDKAGNIYIFVSPMDSNYWCIYKYSASRIDSNKD